MNEAIIKAKGIFSRRRSILAILMFICLIIVSGCGSFFGGLIKEFDIEKVKTGEMTYSAEPLSSAKIEITKLEGMGFVLAGVHGLSGDIILPAKKVDGSDESIRISIDADKTSVSGKSVTIISSLNKIAPQTIPLNGIFNERYRREEPIVLTLKNNVLIVEMDGKKQILDNIKEFTGVLHSANEVTAHVKVFKN